MDGTTYCVYGDRSYSRCWHLELLFQGVNLSAAKKGFKKAMFQVRITVGCIFNKEKMYFTPVYFKSKTKIMESPVRLLHFSSMLLCHFRNCISPN